MFPYWRKQTPEVPLFPDIEWERPERRDQAGSLLIIGGSTHGFRAVHEAYQTAEDHGIGQARVLVPEPLRKITKHLSNVAYASATTTGYFSTKSLETMLFAAAACDGVLLVGDVGRNSETAVVLSQFAQTYNGPLAVTKDAFDCLYSEARYISQRPNTLLVLAEGQLQRYLKEQSSPIALTSTLELTKYIERLHDYTLTTEPILISRHMDTFVVAKNGEVVTTKFTSNEEIWRVGASTRAIVGWLHHRDKPFEGISASLLHLFN